MPWTGKSFSKHNKKLTPKQATQAAKVANAVLKETGDEGKAIAIANAQANKQGKHDPMEHGYHKESA